MEDCLYQCSGDLVCELQRKVEKFKKKKKKKFEVHELQRKVEEVQRKMDESFGKFESTLTEIKIEFRCEQQQTRLAPHSMQKPHAPHDHHKHQNLAIIFTNPASNQTIIA
jgi:small-conductance mechanosensitive channel